jgi:hypothetical protein
MQLLLISLLKCNKINNMRPKERIKRTEKRMVKVRIMKKIMKMKMTKRK